MKKLHDEFKLNTPQAWTNLMMYIDNTGKFKMNYNYDEVKLAPHEQRIIWKYKYLGIYPTDKYNMNLVDEYIKEHQNEKEQL